jgi:MFS family permease
VAWIAPPTARAIARGGDTAAPSAGLEHVVDRRRWQDELREGVRWLWDHRFLRSLAITLGLLNLLSNVSTASWVLFAQEVLDTNSTEFALITVISSIGALVGGWLSGRLTRRFGSGVLLRWALVTFTGVTVVIGFVSSWPLAAGLLALEFFTTVQWNVITVSLRQTIIPDRLLGRVNSVYRFFAWGMIPIGTAVGGLIVVLTERLTSRETALRMPWWIAGGGYLVLLGAYALPRLTTANIERARAEAKGPVPSADTGSGR